MLVWVFAFLFAMLFGGLGYGSGAIRMLVALIGTVISIAVMDPLGRLLEPVAAKVAADNIALREGLPGFIAFVLVWLVIYGLGFLAHQPVMLHMKYQEDDATRDAFGKMNQAGGAVVGLLIALIVFFMVGKRVYVGGYLTAQTTGEGANEPALVKLGTSARRSMAGTAWEKTFAALDNTPARFYEISDVLGLVYENPALLEYLRDYPPFYSMEEKQEVQDIAADPEFLDLLKNKAGFSQVVNHPKIRSVLANPELVAALQQTDLVDFTAWMKTGVSPKYADEKILGRWRVDVANVLLSMRRQRGNIPPTEFAALRAVLGATLTPLRFRFYTDGRFTVTSTGAAPANPDAAAEPVPTAGAGAGMDPSLAARYGIAGRGAPRPAAGEGAAAAAPKAPPFKMDLSGEGQWQRNPDGKYTLTHPALSRGGKVEATLSDLGRVVVPLVEAKGSLVLLPSN
jgi:Colicin V production protein